MLATHDAVVCVLQVPPGDPTLRIAELDPLDVTLPSDPHPTSELFALVEITMFAGRSLHTKRRLYRELVSALATVGIPEMDITIVLIESPPENWGVRGGRPASEVELGFNIEI